MLRAHSWEWLLEHSNANEVDTLRSGGYDTVKAMTYFYNSVRHELPDGTARHLSTPAKKEGRIIAINRGQNVRVMPYSKEACSFMGIEG